MKIKQAEIVGECCNPYHKTLKTEFLSELSSKDMQIRLKYK